jgi:hypothetical protein
MCMPPCSAGLSSPRSASSAARSTVAGRPYFSVNSAASAGIAAKSFGRCAKMYSPSPQASASMPCASRTSRTCSTAATCAAKNRRASAPPKSAIRLDAERLVPPRQANPPFRPEAPQPGQAASSTVAPIPCSASRSAALSPV